jgi:phosphodiesterase/alkaline phosphatase D-like protein
MHRFRVLVVAALCAATLSVVAATDARALTFTHGVASGEVTAISALLWTRVDQHANLTAEVATSPSFPGSGTLRLSASANAGADFTVKVLAAPLRPNQVYFYRWRSSSTLSPVGTFKTAPLPWVSADVRFAITGDADGTLVNLNPLVGFHNNFEVLDRIREDAPDFFVFDGDTIYPDSLARTAFLQLPVPIGLAAYRQLHQINRSIAPSGNPPALAHLMQSTSTYAEWDDHEVINDFDGKTVDPALFAIGRQAFTEYYPILDRALVTDRTCAGKPFFRVFFWGKDVEVILLDQRSCRSADAEPSCLLAPGVSDLVPTLPSPVRQQLAIQFGIPLPPNPPPGCLAAIFDPARTMLGPVQKALFKLALLAPAKFKFVINGPIIQQIYALPYDRWEGYGAERTEILNFIRAHAIRNVIFLSTDLHTNLINEVFNDAFVDPQPIAHEVVTGPIAEFTFEEEIRLFAAQNNLPDQAFVDGLNSLLDGVVGANCRNLGGTRPLLGGPEAIFTYGLIDVDAATGVATVAVKDSNGDPVPDLGPGGGACALTVGP